MKKNISVISVGLLLAGLTCGCSDDNGLEGQKPSAGTKINFSLASDQKTRTAYDENDTYQINWIDGDKVRIYCDEAENVTNADYDVITPIDEKNQHTSTLKYNPDGLAWGSDNGTHIFFAVYPADNNKVSVSNGIATFKLNTNQICEVVGTADANGHYTTKPDMTNAYMVANLSTTPIDNVTLTFNPVMTTLNITVCGRETNNTEKVTLTGISIVKDKSPVKGEFSYDIATKNIILSTNNESTETVFVRIKNGTNYNLDLEPGQSVTLTVFLPPLDIDANNQLDVRVHATGETTQEVTIGGNTDKNGQTITYTASSKGSLTLGKFPTTQNGNNWITPLDDDIYVSQLSIPGTHDAATSKVSGLIGSAGRTQDYTIEEQLAMGIRAFDLRPTCTNIGGASSGRNPKLPIHHGAIDCDITLTDVFSIFNTFLNNNPGEFIIVTARWENEGDPHVDRINPVGGRKWDIFNQCMTNFLNNTNNYPTARQVTFKPDLTIGEMRNKILIIMRPNQGSNPDSYYADNAHTGTTFVTGWPAGSNDVRQNVIFKSKYQGDAIGHAMIQDYYNVANTDTKISLIKEELGYSAQSHTNSTYTNRWFINHCSGYSGSTVSNTSYSNNAQAVNPNIYEYLTGTDKPVGSTGIMLLDFVGKRVSSASGMTVYGDLLPQAIIDNNYKFRMKRKGE